VLNRIFLEKFEVLEEILSFRRKAAFKEKFWV